MNLLLKRDQSSAAVFSFIPLRIGSGVTFTLHAELELEPEEAAIMQKYNFTKSALVLSDPFDDLKMAFRPALLLGIVALILSAIIFPMGAAVTIAILVIVVMTIVYFRTLREQIIVSHLMAGGRKFRCDSIVDLVQKEAFLQNICAYLRQVMESAKNWGDREVVPIAPLSSEDAKQALLSSRR